jgi:hypothetical protein
MVVELYKLWWPGPGSNRRPSAFQAVLHPSKFRLPWSACCERAYLDHLEPGGLKVWRIWPDGSVAEATSGL